MKLLTVGRCFNGIKDRTGTYKMPDYRLPKFASKKRLPFAAHKAEAPVSKPVQGSLFEEVGVPLAGQCCCAAAEACETHNDQIDATTATQQHCPASQSLQEAEETKGTEGAKEPLFARHPKESQIKLMVKEIIFGHRRRRPQQGNVQGELALDQVKVIRNDLSETDLEIVPSRALQPTVSMSEPRVVPLHKHARDWVTLTLELLNPKKTVFYPSRGVASMAEQNRTPELIAQRR